MPDPYDEILYLRIQQKRKTTAQWAALNPVLLAGEPGVEVLVDGSVRIKVGNGTSTWSQLPYVGGIGGSSNYVHSQISASTTWTIPHNLGFKPSVELLNTGSQEIEGDVVHPSINVCLVYFTTPIAGFARLT